MIDVNKIGVQIHMLNRVDLNGCISRGIREGTRWFSLSHKLVSILKYPLYATLSNNEYPHIASEKNDPTNNLKKENNGLTNAAKNP